MEFEFSKKADSFQAGIFAILNEKKEEMVKAGKKVYNLSVGTPDFKPAPHIMEAVSEAAKNPENYKYALTDRPFLLEAVQNFTRRFGVSIEPEEIMTINGSQEGMAHIAWALCDPGDVVLTPNPGYPIFSIGPSVCAVRMCVLILCTVKTDFCRSFPIFRKRRQKQQNTCWFLIR